jgi:hypothetical protein
MAINRIQKITGASLIALAMTTAAPLSTQLAFAQDSTPATEILQLKTPTATPLRKLPRCG